MKLESRQDYLKTIYKLCEARDRATTSEIALALDLKPASVTSMVKKLSRVEPALLDYRKHHGVKLTPEGEKAALSIIRYHRILETYLCEKLGYDLDEVHDEAERLEHATSPKMIERMAMILGYPTHDPHGDRIPAAVGG